ncbi:MAG: RNA polymerase subunit sigma-70 [Halobacteria archaeon]|nr:RNA polymerase subunit sigma-70 [Halobacteria archaeon]
MATDSGDSIRRISQKIDEPYETVRQKVKYLEESRVLDIQDGVTVIAPAVEKTTYQSATAGARHSPPSIEEAYVVPHFADHDFAFTRIDAVYVWTRGGYQVARSPDDYVIFVAVDTPVEYWMNFFDDFGIPANEERQPAEDIDGSVQVVVEERNELQIEWVEGKPVVPLDDTVEYMQDNFAHFQPALETVDEMYDEVDIDVTYSEGVI